MEPGSKLAATSWVAERVAIANCPAISDDQAYRGMDFLLAALEEIASEIFSSVAHLLNLDLDIVFVDTTSTYWEAEGPDLLPELQEENGKDGEVVNPLEPGRRAFGHSKDFRTDLPQVVIAMAVSGFALDAIDDLVCDDAVMARPVIDVFTDVDRDPLPRRASRFIRR